MVVVVIGCFLVAAGTMADEHRWLWIAIASWAAAIAANNWLRDSYDTTGAAVHGSSLIVAVVVGPMLAGWGLTRLVRRARHGGPEWDGPPPGD
ncbi:MAG: hypothetical protein AAGG08_09145 [Actinomycetota bacterium]